MNLNTTTNNRQSKAASTNSSLSKTVASSSVSSNFSYIKSSLVSDIYIAKQICTENFNTAKNIPSASSSSSLMNKNIEITSNQTSELDKDNEEEKEISLIFERKESVTEETQPVKLNTIQESVEKSSISNLPSSNSETFQEQIIESTLVDKIVATDTTTSSVSVVKLILNADEELLPENNLIENSTKTARLSTDLTECSSTVAFSEDSKEIKFTNLSTIPSTAFTSTANTDKTPSPQDSPSRKSSGSSLKLKISKTPSSSKILSSSQLSLSTIPSGRGADDDSVSKLSDTSYELLRQPVTPETTADKPKSASKLAERAKKKSWYNVLYPNYKSRSQDFNKLFKDVPSDERLIVDYSCALLRDILVQGRLYVSQNYVCFHANIFRWETYLSIKWKDVTSISKEKTALVIPNAISICTANEKYFFATFATRDKSFLMLFRVWQNTLMNKQMSPQELWQWVHNCYGDELGLTTDDEDYIDPTSVPTDNYSDVDFVSALDDTTEQILMEIDNKSVSENLNTNQSENQIETNKSKNSKSNSSSNSSGGSGSGKSKSYSFFISNKSNLNSSTTASASGSDNKASDNNSGRSFYRKSVMKPNVKELTLTSVKPDENMVAINGNSGTKENKGSTNSFDGKRKLSKNTRQREESMNKNLETLPTDISDSSDSDENKIPFVATAECTSTHEGRQLVHTILPINIETLFNLLFSKSKFLVDFHDMRRTTDTNFGEWIMNQDGKKTRTVNLTVQLAASVGPKTSRVTEYQTMRDCSKPNELYSIDINSENAGIPYADSFSVSLHYCLVRTVDDHTMLSVHAQIKYKKSIWTIVKGFIEKNTWAGLEDFYTALLHALQSETCIPPAKGKGRRPRRGTTAQTRSVEETPFLQNKPDSNEQAHASQIRNFTANMPVTNKTMSNASRSNYKWLSVFVIILFVFLIIVNVILLLKLWKLQERIEDDIVQRTRVPNLSALKKLPETHEDWIDLLHQQEILHEEELKRWHTVLQTAIELLKKVSVVCQVFLKNDDKLLQKIEGIHEDL